MSTTLNREAFEHAKSLVKAGKFVRDQRDDWSEHAPSTEEETRFIDKNGWDSYAEWNLGIDRQQSEETKKRFSFPFGDFKKVHRCGVISLESRAAQFAHKDIARAAKELLDLIDAAP